MSAPDNMPTSTLKRMLAHAEAEHAEWSRHKRINMSRLERSIQQEYDWEHKVNKLKGELWERENKEQAKVS